jgi:hypothetical protein
MIRPAEIDLAHDDDRNCLIRLTHFDPALKDRIRRVMELDEVVPT